MSGGYVYIETHPDHPGHLRLLQSEQQPAPDAGSEGSSIRYIVRFNNLFRGYQVLQGQFSHEIVDTDQGLFKVELLDAIAKVETSPLSGERIWLDPELERDAGDQLAQRIGAIKQKRLRVDRLWKTVGFVFVALLLLRALLGG